MLNRKSKILNISDLKIDEISLKKTTNTNFFIVIKQRKKMKETFWVR